MRLRGLQPQPGEDRSTDNLRIGRIEPSATRIGVEKSLDGKTQAMLRGPGVTSDFSGEVARD